MKDTVTPWENWEIWKAENPNAITRSAWLGYGSSTPYDFMLKTAKDNYPDWRVIRINDNKFLCSMGRDKDGEYAVYESSLGLINRQGEQKTLTFHTFGKVLIIY